ARGFLLPSSLPVAVCAVRTARRRSRVRLTAPFERLAAPHRGEWSGMSRAALVRGVRLLPAHVDEHRSHLANGERDLEPDLADRLGLAWRAAVAAKCCEKRLEPFDLGVVPLFRAAHVEPGPSSTAGDEGASAPS